MLKFVKKIALFVGLAVSVAAFGKAAVAETSVVGASGYDLVSYHQDGGPVRGNGNFTFNHNGTDYLFSSKENADQFAAAPEKYLPAYGGYCAYGVKFGKKFIADPEAWKVVDGTLYLNLDEKVQALWVKDIPTYINEANAEWVSIENTPASEL
ncbi:MULTISPECIES: YHS domain-containing (seleno)protein [Curvivirga]|uniref:YHS domain-containing (seleno)protein n=1 Tax=Curvivirga TaxID=2856846 RepID=UPI0012BC983B|nr:YHS domain-containing (seleno)protein [Curvivirga aplysinae]MTI08955.1 YHS domain-containing protein [Curvivirga aplysinae]